MALFQVTIIPPSNLKISTPADMTARQALPQELPCIRPGSSFISNMVCYSFIDSIPAAVNEKGVLLSEGQDQGFQICKVASIMVKGLLNEYC
jgi:hypothetical protein